YEDREHFIPLRKSELVDLLCSDADLSAEERDLFRQFCRLVAATFHFEYHQRLEELKDAYAPFDPDADTRSQLHLSAEETHHRLGKHADTNSVFIKVFKDIPKVDMEMLLPGARVQMPRFDQGKLGASLLSTLGWVGYKIASEVGELTQAFLQKNPLAFWGPLSL